MSIGKTIWQTRYFITIPSNFHHLSIGVWIHLQLGWGSLVKAGMAVVVEGDDTVVEYISHTPASPLRPKLPIEPLVVHVDERLADWPEPGLGQAVENLRPHISERFPAKYHLVCACVCPMQLLH